MTFFAEIVGYDLAGFFERNCATLRAETEAILNSILFS